MSDKFYKDYIIKCAISEYVLTAAKIKQEQALGKNVRGKKAKDDVRGIEKHQRANWADLNVEWNRRKKTVLIITEGDSAKSLAVAGTEIVGRDEYGVFPLRGKLLNVREAK